MRQAQDSGDHNILSKALHPEWTTDASDTTQHPTPLHRRPYWNQTSAAFSAALPTRRPRLAHQYRTRLDQQHRGPFMVLYQPHRAPNPVRDACQGHEPPLAPTSRPRNWFQHRAGGLTVESQAFQQYGNQAHGNRSADEAFAELQLPQPEEPRSRTPSSPATYQTTP